MRKIIPLLVVLAISSTLPTSLVAQKDSAIVRLLTKENITYCPTYILNAKRLIPEYYRANNIDSIYVLLDFLDKECEERVSVFEPLKNLLSIERGTFDNPLCDEKIQSTLFGRFRRRPYSYLFEDIRYSFIKSISNDSSFFAFIKYLTQKILAETDSLSMENLYCHYLLMEYNYVLNRLHNGEFSETCLGTAYAKRIAELRQNLRDSYRLHYSLNLGIWSPQEASGTLGNKLEFGGQIGFHRRRIIAQLSGFLRVLKSANTYEVEYKGKITPTDHFLGGYIGGEFGLETIRIRRFALDLLVGIGYDGFEAINKDKNDVRGINSLNINFGGTTRIFYNKERTRYLGIQGRYNFVKYGTGGGTDLSGNTISLQLVFGYLANQSVVNRAKRLLIYE